VPIAVAGTRGPSGRSASRFIFVRTFLGLLHLPTHCIIRAENCAKQHAAHSHNHSTRQQQRLVTHPLPLPSRDHNTATSQRTRTPTRKYVHLCPCHKLRDSDGPRAITVCLFKHFVR